MINIRQWLGLLTLGVGVPEPLLTNNGIVDKLIHFGGTGLNQNQVIGFYLDWHAVLHTRMLAWQKVLGAINNWVTIGSYQVAQAFESIFRAVLKLFGMFDQFKVGEMGALYKTIVLLAFVLLAMGLSYLLVENIFRARTPLHEALRNLVMMIAVLIMLPFGTNLFGQFVQAGGDDLTGKSGSSPISSITLEPLQNNIVDTLTVAQKGFKTDPKKLDANISKLNNISDKNISYLDFSDVVAADNLKVVQIPKGTDNVFKHGLTAGTGTYQGGINTYFVTGVALPDKQNQLSKALSPVYPRYTGHFVMANLQLWLIALMFAFIAFRVGKSWFEIFLLNLSAPLMALQDVRTSQRLKEVLQAIEGAFMGVFVELIGLRLFLIVLHWLGSPTNPGVAYLTHFPNSAVPRALFLIMMYLACFAAFMKGTSLVERWTGVPQDKHGLTMGGLMAAGLGFKAAGATFGVGKKVGHGIKKALTARHNGAELPDPTNADTGKTTQRDDQAATKPTPTPTAAKSQGSATPNASERDDQTGTPQQSADPTQANEEAATSAGGEPSSAAAGDSKVARDGDTAKPDSTGDDLAPADVERADDADDTGVPDPTSAVNDPAEMNREGEEAPAGGPDPTSAVDDEVERADAEGGTPVPDPTSATASDGEVERADNEGETGVPDPTVSESADTPASQVSDDESAGSPDPTVDPAAASEVSRNDQATIGDEPNPTKSPASSAPTGEAKWTSGYDEDEREVFERPVDQQPELVHDDVSEPKGTPIAADTNSTGDEPTQTRSAASSAPTGEAKWTSGYDEDEREVFERPVDQQPELVHDDASEPAGTSIKADTSSTGGGQGYSTATRTSSTGTPKKPAKKGQPGQRVSKVGNRLIQQGVAQEIGASQNAHQGKSMVNLPEIKVDDSIY